MSGRNESKADKEKLKQIQDKCQSVLNQLLRDEDNKYCVDCDAKGPRWASWNLGVFLCIRCAGIHRNLGVHISKVRSVNLDSWTPEQVVSLQQMGNSRARAVYEATLPDTWRRPQNDSSLETFIRAKYEHKKYIAKEWVPQALPKVNWEKEIEEEAEKQKKKKKEKQQQLTSSLPPVKKVDVTVPALPKPSNSPKSNRTISATSFEKQPTSAAVDLLGLSSGSATNGDNSEDIFSSFLSAPVVSAPPAPQVTTKENETKELCSEEDSFFNQPATSVVSDPKKPLSKDSIMALYSSQAPTPAQPTMFHTAGMFPSNPPMGFPGATGTGFPVLANTGFTQPGNAMIAPPGTVGYAPTGFQSGFMAGPPMACFPAPYANGVQTIPSAGPNPFMGMSMAMAPNQGFPPQHGSQSKPSDDLLADFPSSTNLSDQLSGLNLGGMGQAPGPAMGGFPQASPFASVNQRPPATMAPMGQTFTTQLWQ